LEHFIFVTGQPGIGKTSVLLKAANELRKKGYKIGGMISSEARERGVRVGFEILDISTGRKGWLANVDQPTGRQVGKYRVNLNDLDTIGTNSILEAINDADVIVVDEIGPMELCSSAFREAIVNAMKKEKPLVGTIHQNAHDPLITAVKRNNNTEIIEVTHENRQQLHNIIIDRVLQNLRHMINDKDDDKKRLQS
jgi:nucleoside-triphosphatase